MKNTLTLQCLNTVFLFEHLGSDLKFQTILGEKNVPPINVPVLYLVFVLEYGEGRGRWSFSSKVRPAISCQRHPEVLALMLHPC